MFKVVQVDESYLLEFKKISIAFEVNSIYEVIEDNDRIELIERKLSQSYTKDYDELESNSPNSWLNRDVSNWGIFLAFDETQNNRPIGGAIVTMPECVLMDIRVLPSYRHLGIGKSLFNYAVKWALQQRVAKFMTIETQNTNVIANRFYARMGAKLYEIDRNAYKDDEQVKHEIRVNWRIDLTE